MLSYEQKLFVLFTKGHFNEYVNPEKVIISKALMMYPNDVSNHNILNFSISVFDKLMELNAIDDVGADKYSWMIKEMREIGNCSKQPTLYEWLHTKIQWANCGELSLDLDLTNIKSKMELKNDKTEVG